MTREANEDSYCKETINPILMSLSNVENVHYCHGTSEHGKDFTFDLIGPDGERIHCGMQVKYGNITGNVTKLGTIRDQIIDAFNVPYGYTPNEKN